MIENKLFASIAQARENPEIADIAWLLNFLDLATVNLDLETSLKINGRAIEAIAKIWERKSLDALNEWLDYETEAKATIAIAEDILQGLGLVQQSVSFDLEDLILDEEKEEVSSGLDFNSKLIINSVFSSIININSEELILLDHDEDIQTWIVIVTNCLNNQKKLNFLELIKAADLSPARVFLAVLHGDFYLYQTDFYDCNSLLISRS